MLLEDNSLFVRIVFVNKKIIFHGNLLRKILTQRWPLKYNQLISYEIIGFISFEK
jgi:hypothetical protein